jgi:hypothetical protein
LVFYIFFIPHQNTDDITNTDDWVHWVTHSWSPVVYRWKFWAKFPTQFEVTRNACQYHVYWVFFLNIYFIVAVSDGLHCKTLAFIKPPALEFLHRDFDMLWFGIYNVIWEWFPTTVASLFL